MKISTIKITHLLILIITISIIGIFIIKKYKTYASEEINTVTSFTGDYSITRTLGLNMVSDYGEGIQINFPNTLNYIKEDEFFGKLELKNVISISQNNGSKLLIKIIPLILDNSSSTLSQLEKFIVIYSGVIPKDNQSLFQNNGFDIAQIGYHTINEDGVNYFDVYTLLRKDNKGWLVFAFYSADSSKVDSLNLQNSKESIIYKQIVDSLSIWKIPTGKFNYINKTRLSPDLVNEFHKYNNKFKSDI